jgi:hypothetical protein
VISFLVLLQINTVDSDGIPHKHAHTTPTTVHSTDTTLPYNSQHHHTSEQQHHSLEHKSTHHHHGHHSEHHHNHHHHHHNNHNSSNNNKNSPTKVKNDDGNPSLRLPLFKDLLGMYVWLCGRILHVRTLPTKWFKTTALHCMNCLFCFVWLYRFVYCVIVYSVVVFSHTLLLFIVTRSTSDH